MKIFLTLLVLLSVAAQAIELHLTWDDPPTGIFDGFNLYQLGDDGVLHVRLNQEGIFGNSFPVDAQPLDRFVVRAYNHLGESPDSNILTIPEVVPPAPEGLAVRVILLQSSTDMAQWSNIAMVGIPDQPRGFYRLVWQ